MDPNPSKLSELFEINCRYPEQNSNLQKVQFRHSHQSIRGEHLVQAESINTSIGIRRLELIDVVTAIKGTIVSLQAINEDTERMDKEIDAAQAFATSKLQIDCQNDFQRYHRQQAAPRRVDDNAGFQKERLQEVLLLVNSANNAAKAVMNEGKSVNAAAKEFDIKRMTLTRFIKKLKSESGTPPMGYAAPSQAFSSEQKDFLKKYLLQMASIFYGYSPKDVRCHAYECAVAFGIKIPVTWTTNKMAKKEWLMML
ncbi:hypothetical protein ILUMI_25385 [Ignelater luminosus]|uniref:HTH psq-type domain-containing protein n=1 Tax=Ignelater luminosus TaxID=2038154 RepID=A0A8K0C8M9_IGNLU|nr:hypothetical protein ILUMI_25385 [Ignelater luminosus]